VRHGFVLELPGFGLAYAEASAVVFASLRKAGRFWGFHLAYSVKRLAYRERTKSEKSCVNV